MIKILFKGVYHGKKKVQEVYTALLNPRQRKSNKQTTKEVFFRKLNSNGINQTLQRGHFTEEGGVRCLPATTLVQRKMQLKQNLSATQEWF